MVIRELAVRLNVVAALKVTPSDEFVEVCSTSLRKISSLGFSGVASLLRVTVALPVNAATLPIGSSFAACASVVASVAGGVGKGVAAGVGVFIGWVCASLVALGIASTKIGGCPTSKGDGMAKTFPMPARMRQHASQTAKENQCLV